MSSVNKPHHSSCILRERSQNFLNVQVSDFLNQYSKPITTTKTSKANISPDQNFRTFQRNLELQKQIISDQDMVHLY